MCVLQMDLDLDALRIQLLAYPGTATAQWVLAERRMDPWRQWDLILQIQHEKASSTAHCWVCSEHSICVHGVGKSMAKIGQDLAREPRVSRLSPKASV